MHDFGIEPLLQYAYEVNELIINSIESVDLGSGIKTFSVSFTCFIGNSEEKSRLTYYQGKKKKKLRTFGMHEFEDDMEIICSLDFHEALQLVKNGSEKETKNFLVIKTVEAINSLRVKYQKKTPLFNWDKLLDVVNGLLDNEV